MTHTVYCLKLKQELPGLARQPYPGPLGEKVYNHISAQAWTDLMRHQTMLINEYRLNLLDPDSRVFLEKELEKFLFGEGSAAPDGYIPIDDGGK
jgi:Fe-S cluster biosynthesis and repair protein YggX